MPELITARPSMRLRAVRAVNRVVQLVSLWFLGEWALFGALRCPFVVPFVSCQNCPVITCPGRMAHLFWGFWGAWLALGLLAGRAFCGWVCPGGVVTRLLALNPLRLKKLLPSAVSDLSKGKYVLLAVAIIVYFVLGQPRVNVPIRVGEFWPSVGLTFQHAFPLWQVRTALLLVMVAASLCIAGAWCRFACPMGGLLELLRRFSLVRIFKTKDCVECDLCRRACYLQTRPDEANCTNCGDCLTSCPKDCIRIGRKAS